MMLHAPPEKCWGLWSSPTQSKKRRQPWPCATVGLRAMSPRRTGAERRPLGGLLLLLATIALLAVINTPTADAGRTRLDGDPRLSSTNIMAARRCGMLPAHYAGCLHTDAARCTLGSSSAAAHAPPAGHLTMCTWHAGTTRANLAIAALICPRHHLRPHHQPPAAHQPGNLRSLVSIHSPAALAATCSCAQVPPGARQWQRRWRRW